MANINYRVNVNWIDFDFDDPYQAIHFANLAEKHIKETSKRISIDFEIKEEFKDDSLICSGGPSECEGCCGCDDEEFEPVEGDDANETY